MRGNRNHRRVVRVKDIVKSDFGPVVLGRGRFFGDAVPQFVGFCKRRFEPPGREERGNVCFVGAVVAGMRAYALSDQFFDCGDKGRGRGESQVGEGEVCGFQAAG